MNGDHIFFKEALWIIYHLLQKNSDAPFYQFQFHKLFCFYGTAFRVTE